MKTRFTAFHIIQSIIVTLKLTVTNHENLIYSTKLDLESNSTILWRNCQIWMLNWQLQIILTSMEGFMMVSHFQSQSVQELKLNPQLKKSGQSIWMMEIAGINQSWNIFKINFWQTNPNVVKYASLEMSQLPSKITLLTNTSQNANSPKNKMKYVPWTCLRRFWKNFQKFVSKRNSLDHLRAGWYGMKIGAKRCRKSHTYLCQYFYFEKFLYEILFLTETLCLYTCLWILVHLLNTKKDSASHRILSLWFHFNVRECGRILRIICWIFL